MGEEPQRHEINLNVSFTPAPPRPRRRHSLGGVVAILFAAALIGTASGSSIVFGVVAGISLLLYVFFPANGTVRQGK